MAHFGRVWKKEDENSKKIGFPEEMIIFWRDQNPQVYSNRFPIFQNSVKYVIIAIYYTSSWRIYA
jgi:hypothetical protein